MSEQFSTTDKFASFERTTRNLRWTSIVLVLLTFPLHAPQLHTVYVLLAVMAIYNASRYLSVVRRSEFLHSPILMLSVDILFAGFLIALVGNIDTPYSAQLVFMIINAAYLYQLPGVIAVALVQSAILFVVTTQRFVEPIVLSSTRLIVITIFALLALGYLVARLTSGDREERAALVDLREESDRERLRLRTLVDSLNVAIFVTDSDGKILHHNEAARVLSGKEGVLDGVSFAKALDLRPRTNPQADPVNILKDSASAQHRRDLSVSLEDGKTIDLDISVTPVQSGKNKPAEYILVCEDITTERSLEEQRSEFISVASHELRTPLAILEAALETALMPNLNLSPEAKTLVEQAHRNATLLSGIIKDITILAEAKNDNLPIQLSQINPTALFDGIVKDFAAQAGQKNIVLEAHVDPKTPAALSTERYIHEILQNYMTNALKYSEKGTITLAAGPTKSGGVLFSVQDQGIGISPKNQKQLFTKFFRAEDYRTRTTGGTGLGLYLCMEIAQRLGGKLWCKSTLNEGSTFYLEIPPFSNLKRDQGEVVEAQVANLVDGL